MKVGARNTGRKSSSTGCEEYGFTPNIVESGPYSPSIVLSADVSRCERRKTADDENLRLLFESLMVRSNVTSEGFSDGFGLAIGGHAGVHVNHEVIPCQSTARRGGGEELAPLPPSHTPAHTLLKIHAFRCLKDDAEVRRGEERYTVQQTR